MNSINKQKGFAMLASMSIVLGVVVVGSMWVAEESAKRRILTNSESFYNRIIYLRTQVHAFVNDRYLEGHRINGPAIFPNRLGALEPKYIPACTTADNQKGFCMKVNQTPWGEIGERDYRVVPVPKDDGSGVSHYRAEFDVKLPDRDSVALKFERQTTLTMLAQVPNIFYDDANNILTVRIDRPDKAFAYESLLKRSGDDSTLLGDLDIGGNYAITNAKDVTIRNSDGTQKIVSKGLSQTYLLKHGDTVKKPSCPSGTTAKIILGLGSISVKKEFELTGSQRPYLIEDNARDWKVGLAIRVKNLNDGQYDVRNDGEIITIVKCE
jgi:hypothetical protein